LELGSVSAEYAVEFVAVGRDVGTDQIVDFDGLLVANQRNHSEAQRLAPRHFLVFGLLHGGRKQRGNGHGFLVIDLAVTGSILRRDVRWCCGRKRTRLVSRKGLIRPS